MRILFLSDNFPPETNAPATRLVEHARAWLRAGHSIRVVTCAPNFPDGVVHAGYRNRWHAREDVEGIEVVRVKTYIAPNRGFLRRTLDYLSFGLAGLVAGLFGPRPDVVVGTSPQFFAALGAWGVAALRHVPFVMEVRDLWPASIAAVGALRHGRLLRALERLELFLYRRAASIVVLTESFRTDLVRRGVPAEKIELVRNGVDLSRYAPRERDAALTRELGLEQGFVVGYLGTHGLAHALENVLDAAERLRSEERVRFLFVGSGAARDGLIAEAERRGLGNVRFLPPQPKEAMPAIWSLCDVALVHLKDTPVFRTVLPSKIFEAMGMGCPILLAAPRGEATELVEHEGAGLTVPAEDPDALAAAVLQLLRDGVCRARLRRSSAAAAANWSRERLAAEMLRVLARAAGAELGAAQAPAAERERLAA